MTTTRALGSVFRRDARIQLSSPFQYVSQATGIVFSLFSFFFIGMLVGDSPALENYGGPYFPFAVIGVVVVSISSVALTTFTGTIRGEQQGGILEILLASPMRLRSLIAGSFMWPLTVAALLGVVFFVLVRPMSGGAFDLRALPLALPALLLTILSFAAIGLVRGALVVVTKRGDLFTPIIITETSLVQGRSSPLRFSSEGIPGVAHPFPAFHGFNAIRSVMLSGKSVGDTLDEILILGFFTAALAVVGAVLWRRARRPWRDTGTLSAG